MTILVPKSEDLFHQLYGIIQQRLAHYQAIQDSPWEGKSARLESENIVELFHAGLDAIATQADTNVLYAGIFEMGDGTGDVRTSISDGNTQDDVFLLRHQGNSGYPPRLSS